jgi:predicted acetylornithine/succinylornithine family transaminase
MEGHALLLRDESQVAVESREREFVAATYRRTPFHPQRGEGARLFDSDGNPYWDLLGGIAVNALGYQHPALVATLESEAATLLHVSNLFFHPTQGLLAERLVKSSGLSRAFFCNSGTEANEAALKFARLANPGRGEVVALNGSFHGRTLGALSLTGNESYRAPFQPLVPGVTFVAPNDAEALEQAVSPQTAAIFVEPILGEGGVVPLDAAFLRAARRCADRSGALLVCDEIQCGLGRTGWLFAYQASDIVPDIATLAKPLGGGLPLGAVLVGDNVKDAIRPGMHGTTFGGNPLACRLGLVVLDEIEGGLLGRVRQNGEWLRAQLEQLQLTHGSVVDVRGAGFMWGIELDREAAPVASSLLSRGFVVGTAGRRVIRLLPPYVTPKQAFREFLHVVAEILEET